MDSMRMMFLQELQARELLSTGGRRSHSRDMK
jgi:hypothetical protein